MQNITDRKQAGTTASGHLRDPCNDNTSCLRCILYSFSGSTFKHSVFFSGRIKELLHVHKVSFVTQKYLGKAYHLYICDLVGIIFILSPWPPPSVPTFIKTSWQGGEPSWKSRTVLMKTSRLVSSGFLGLLTLFEKH